MGVSHNKDGNNRITEVHIDNQTPFPISRLIKPVVGDDKAKDGTKQYWQLESGKIHADKNEVGRDMPQEVPGWKRATFTVSGRESALDGPKGSAFFSMKMSETIDIPLTLKWDNNKDLKGRAEILGAPGNHLIVICDVDASGPYQLTFHICMKYPKITEQEIAEVKQRDQANPGFAARWVQPIWRGMMEDLKKTLCSMSLHASGTGAAELVCPLGPLAGGAGFNMDVALRAGMEGDKYCTWTGARSNWVGEKGIVQ